MRNIIAIMAVACLIVASEAALTDAQVGYLKWYDEFALVGIWKQMIYLTFYNFIASYICSSQNMAVVALVSTLMTED